jgi:hypothetical protein
LIAVIILLGIGTYKYKHSTINNSEKILPPPNEYEKLKNLFYVMLICAGSGIVISYIWLMIMRKFARFLIIFTLVASFLITLGFAIFLFAEGSVVGGIIFLFFAFLQGIFYLMWRKRIPFATQMLQTVSTLIEQYPATTVVAYVSLIVELLWITLWLFTATFSQLLGSIVVIALFLVFSFYWTIQVIKNVVHVTVSGTFATWYFLHGTTGVPPNPTIKSFQRAMSTSFGSICLGSLIVAIIQTLRLIANSIKNESRNIVVFIVAAIASCILQLLDSLAQYFNLYAFTQVAIYGKSFCKAAKDTWSLIKSHGIEAIINDNLISGVLTMGALVGGVMCALIGGLAGLSTVPSYWVVCAVFGFFIGFVMVLLVMEVVQSGVACIFVCFAMDPAALQRNDPILYAKFRETYGIW